MSLTPLPQTYHARIRDKLTAAFQPLSLDIQDESARHAGHAGHNPLGETHFSVTIVSAAFAGKRPVERHRLIYQALATELAERVHALSLNAKTPQEINQE